MLQESFDLTGKVAIVTGGGAGIGRAVILRLSRAGAAVVVADVDESAACSVEKEVRSSGGDALAVRVDVTHRSSVEAMAERVQGHFGRIDALVNNAGIAGRSLPLWDLRDADWESVLAVNLTGVFLCSRAVIRYMMKRKTGRIVNIASIAGKEGNPKMIPLLLFQSRCDWIHQSSGQGGHFLQYSRQCHYSGRNSYVHPRSGSTADGGIHGPKNPFGPGGQTGRGGRHRTFSGE